MEEKKTKADDGSLKERRNEAARKAMLVVKEALGSASAVGGNTACGERVATFHIAGDFKSKPEGSKSYEKEAFRPGKPILGNREKYKSRNEKNGNLKVLPFYSDMVVRRTGNDVTSAKSEGKFSHRSEKSQHETNTSLDTSYKEGPCVARKTFQKSLIDKDDNSSHADRPMNTRLKSERENVSAYFGNKRSKDFNTTSHVDNSEKIFYPKETTVSKMEKNGRMAKNNVSDSKSKAFSMPKPVKKGCIDQEKILGSHEGKGKFVKAKGAISEASDHKGAESEFSCVDEDGLKSKSENPVSARFTGSLPGRIPGTHSLIDIEKHSRCCKECLEARAKSARHSRRVAKKEDTNKVSSRDAIAQVVVEKGATSKEHLESSIVFFRNALTAVEVLEKLFQNIGNTKEFLQHIYDGLEESGDVARCRRNLAEARLEDGTVTQPQDETNKDKGTVEKQEDENNKNLKTKKKEHKIKFKTNGPNRKTTEATRKSEQKPKQKRDKNLLELSDEWKKRNHQGKQGT